MNAELVRGNGASAMCAVAVVVLVNVVLRNGLAPGGTTAERLMMNVDTGVDDIDVDILNVGNVGFPVEVLGEGAEAELLTM